MEKIIMKKLKEIQNVEGEPEYSSSLRRQLWGTL